jgi:ABC-type uncharacterized transport system fused permease/ATPase subunit
LHAPDIEVLDEATAALDEKSQDKMMETVIRELPDVTIISVAHRAELEAYHSRKILWGGARMGQSSTAISIWSRVRAAGN